MISGSSSTGFRLLNSYFWSVHRIKQTQTRTDACKRCVQKSIFAARKLRHGLVENFKNTEIQQKKKVAGFMSWGLLFYG